MMKHDTARALAALLLRQGAEQNEILKQVQQDEPPDEFRRVRAMIGKTMGAIYSDALYPIFKEHPVLKPADLP